MPRLRAENLSLFHLDGIDLTVEAGECVALSGPSGAGKTLLLRAICDLVPHSGTVFLDETVSDRFSPWEWRRQVGMLPAESRWWFDTVGPHFPEIQSGMLERLGFSPDVMDWEVARLSSGERQRLALLRLLANQPAVMLLDEPTANLDAAARKRVEAVLEEVRNKRGTGLLWVSHDAAQIQRVAHRSLVLAGGALREGGTT